MTIDTGPRHIVVPITAIGSTDAIERAKAYARDRGYRLRTVCSVQLVEGQAYTDSGRERLTWVVELAVRE
jgi:hypothetical protein